MYAIETLGPHLACLHLDAPKGLPEPFDQPTSVYLVQGPEPALVNAGHALHHEALCLALGELGLLPGDIARVVYTSWDPGHLGGAALLPGADHFVFSPDMQAPRAYGAHLAMRRLLYEGVLGEVAEAWGLEEGPRRQVQAFLGRWFAAPAAVLDFVPMDEDMIVRLGELALRVVHTPGPAPGHVALWEASRRLVFAGQVSMSDLPREIVETEAYLKSLDRLGELAPDLVLASHGPVSVQGAWMLKRATRFFHSFLNHVPQALVRHPTVLEYLGQDLGLGPESLRELGEEAGEEAHGVLGEVLVGVVFAAARYRALFEELVRAGVVQAAGEGLAGRRYGLNLEDPRAPVRR